MLTSKGQKSNSLSVLLMSHVFRPTNISSDAQLYTFVMNKVCSIYGTDKKRKQLASLYSILCLQQKRRLQTMGQHKIHGNKQHRTNNKITISTLQTSCYPHAYLQVRPVLFKSNHVSRTRSKIILTEPNHCHCIQQFVIVSRRKCGGIQFLC